MSKPADRPQWVRIAEQFEHSGLTQKQFAQRQGLPLSTVQSWVYRRRRQMAAPSGPPVRLLPVEMAAPAVSSAGKVEVLTVRGVRVSFAMGTDVSYVARLVEALERPSC
jgi:transposase